MKKIFNLLPLFLFVCSLPVQGEQYKYVKGQNIFEIGETPTKYEVVCRKDHAGMISRNRNILDRQLRMDAVNLIGVYILFKEESKLSSDLFQIYADGINLHYNAYVEGMTQEERTVKGETCIVYSCAKRDYRIEAASYDKNIDIPSLLEVYYEQNKGGDAAAMLYGYEHFTSGQYLMLERDFLLGNTALPPGLRVLQAMTDRFETSVYSLDDNNLKDALKPLRNAVPETQPYKQFFYEEMLTAAPLNEKDAAYRKWRQSLSSPHCLWEDFLLFCCGRSAAKTGSAFFSGVIEAYPGAISPFGVRQPLDEAAYFAATQAYARSDFDEAARILRESIDNEGISVRNLNLLGASYRFLGMPEKAIPFLLLGFKLDSASVYVTGNIALCAAAMNYPRLRELCDFLSGLATDEWSRNEINMIMHN